MWWGNAAADPYGAGDTYGQYNAYDVNYIGVWPLSEDPTSSAPQYLDRSLKLNHGVAQNGMTSDDVVPGIIGRAAEFDGLDDYVEIADNASLDLTVSLTVEANVSVNSWPDNNFPVLVKRRNTGEGVDDINYSFTVRSDGVLALFYRDNAQLAHGFTTDASHISDNADWHHIAASITFGNANSATFFVDGNAKPIIWTNGDGTNPTVANNWPLTIGYDYYSTGVDTRFADGKHDEVRLSNTNRSESCIKANYHNQFNTTGFLTFADVTLSKNNVAIEGLRIYPNPTNNSWTIQTKDQIIKRIEVYNVVGERVLFSQPDALSVDINASNLTPGIYFSTIHTDLGSATRKLVKH